MSDAKPIRKLIVGVNDLKTTHPEIAVQAYEWDPEAVTAGSSKKKNWKCKEGHVYISSVQKRTSRGGGCPYCSNYKVLAGFNDLQTKFPDIAAEAYGWDPSKVGAGTDKKGNWKCKEGHIYNTSIVSRTSKRSGCPICSGLQALAGFNDLQTKFPDIAAEAYGWDPSKVTAASARKMNWKCKKEHLYNSVVFNRTSSGSGCPICSGLKVLAGFNDLQTKFPDIAAEAYGWDPSKVGYGTRAKKDWKCKEGHIYSSKINSRTSRRHGCPICSGLKVLAGFNDLQTKFPDIAAEAYGWDPSKVGCGTKQKKDWKCIKGHIFCTIVNSRTSRRNGCPICSGYQVLEGFNDLQTKFPDIAAEAYGWDPSKVVAGSNQRKSWKCEEGHIYHTKVNSRTTSGSGCPVCAKYGFNPEKDAWFYLMQRPGEQQLGITNDLPARMRTHEKNGWTLLEYIGPCEGRRIVDAENLFKRWLRKSIGLMEGTTENWATTSMEVQTLAELKAKSGIEIDLF